MVERADRGPVAEAASPAEATGTVRFDARLRAAMERADSLICIGLDPDLARFPAHLRDEPDAVLRFNAAIVEATHDLACAYKPNLGFYAALGVAGIEALVATRRLVPPHIPVILDCKVGDLGNTAAAYARGYFEAWGFDAVTANPYLGEDSLAPFLGYDDRGVIVLCKTSNPGGGDLQDVVVRDAFGISEPLHLMLAKRAATWAERYPASVGLVVGATYPAELAAVRARCPNLPILLPGVGAQGGDLEAAVEAGIDAEGFGLMVSSSRGITYAGEGPDFAERARQATEQLRDAVRRVTAKAF